MLHPTFYPCIVVYPFDLGPDFYVSGANGMLRVVLNAEIYEHMRGPHNDAGIKV